MSSLIEIEQAAAKLRRYLKLAQRPDLKLICGLCFFDLFRDNQTISPESYLREFLPVLAEAAGKCPPRELCPQDAESLARLIELVAKQSQGMPAANDLALLRRVDSALAAGAPEPVEITAENKGGIRVPCLFVEYYPDLDISPRGRMLDLHVTASPISAKAEADDIVVRNPVSEPDDRFLAQARDSVAAARIYLADRYGLSPKKRYRFDFAVDSTGARFTGDSLGAAFAVGAAAAVAQIEVFRERLSVASTAAFSGALTPDGKLNLIDAEALKLKIFRAFHSNLRLLVIPREHITDAWAYLSELEVHFPGRKLELVGAESLEDIVSDPRLVRPERFSTPAFLFRRAWQAKRSIWVEVPVALALPAILFYIIAPAGCIPGFDDNPEYARLNPTENSIEIMNRDSTFLWQVKYACKWLGPVESLKYYVKIVDLNSDGKNEVLVLPVALEECPERDSFYCYSFEGRPIFQRYGAVRGVCADESDNLRYDAMYINVAQSGGKPIIITELGWGFVGRSHIAVWSTTGDRLGWYINAGCSHLFLSTDFDNDGRTELFFLNYNNPMNCVALLVLKADSVFGTSPPYDGNPCSAAETMKGTQIAYVLFPVSDLGRVPGELKSKYNHPGNRGVVILENGIIGVYVAESQPVINADLIYSLDRRFRVVGVRQSDQYVKRRGQLVEAGLLAPVQDESAYTDGLRDAVVYWTDSGWVTEGQLRAAVK